MLTMLSVLCGLVVLAFLLLAYRTGYSDGLRDARTQLERAVANAGDQHLEQVQVIHVEQFHRAAPQRADDLVAGFAHTAQQQPAVQRADMLQHDAGPVGLGYRHGSGRSLHLTVGAPDVAGALDEPVRSGGSRCRNCHDGRL